MKNSKLFKVVFWILTFIALTAMVTVTCVVFTAGSGDPDFPYFMYFFIPGMFLFLLVIFGSIAVFVHRDAKKRGMNAWMWTLIAVFVPNLIGLIIYIIVRGNYIRKCPTCGKQISQEYSVCPYCGKELNIKCSQCSREVSADWKVCPYCSNKLN